MLPTFDKKQLNDSYLPQSQFYIATHAPNRLDARRETNLFPHWSNTPFLLSDTYRGPIPGFVYGKYPPIGRGYFRVRASNHSSSRSNPRSNSAASNYSNSGSNASSYQKNNMFVSNSDHSQNFRNTNDWREALKMLASRMKPSDFK